MLTEHTIELRYRVLRPLWSTVGVDPSSCTDSWLLKCVNNALVAKLYRLIDAPCGASLENLKMELERGDLVYDMTGAAWIWMGSGVWVDVPRSTQTN